MVVVHAVLILDITACRQLLCCAVHAEPLLTRLTAAIDACLPELEPQAVCNIASSYAYFEVSCFLYILDVSPG